jgi:hypothetical protein
LTVDPATANFKPTTYLTDQAHSLEVTNTAQLNGQDLTVILPPRSLTTITLSSDTTPPVSVATADPGPNGAGWNNGNVVVTIHADDNGGSGVKQITTGRSSMALAAASPSSLPQSSTGRFEVTEY